MEEQLFRSNVKTCFYFEVSRSEQTQLPLFLPFCPPFVSPHFFPRSQSSSSSVSPLFPPFSPSVCCLFPLLSPLSTAPPLSLSPFSPPSPQLLLLHSLLTEEHLPFTLARRVPRPDAAGDFPFSFKLYQTVASRRRCVSPFYCFCGGCRGWSLRRRSLRERGLSGGGPSDGGPSGGGASPQS